MTNTFTPDPTIEKFISIADKKESGLTLISAGTGRGKSTVCFNYIKDSYNKYDLIVYVAPNHAIIKEGIYKNLLGSEYKDSFVYLKSSLENITSDPDNTIKSINVECFKNAKIKEDIETLQSFCDYYLSQNDFVVKERLGQQITERKAKLKAYVKKNRPKINTKKENLISFDELQEIKKIFPEDLNLNKKIYLMTASKLDVRLDSVETPYKIMSKEFMKRNKNWRTLVILDESDKDYDFFLTKCCEENSPLEDMLSPIQNVAKYIGEDDSHWEKCKFKENEENVLNYRRDLDNLIKETNAKYGILNHFKTEGINNGERIELFAVKDRCFLFNLKDNRTYDLVKGKEETTLKLVDGGIEKFNIFEFIFDLKKIHNKIWNLVGIIADIRLSEQHKNSIDTSYEDCLSYAIHQVFNKSNTEARFYIEYMLSNKLQLDALRNKDTSDIDRNKVWRDGFMMCSFNDPDGSNHTYIEPSGMMGTTPDNKFIWLAKNANVISLSATQQIGGAFLPNFDYIKKMIGEENYHEYKEDDFANSEKSRSREKNNIVCEVIKNKLEKDEIQSYVNKLIENIDNNKKEEIEGYLEEYFDAIDAEDKDYYIKQNLKYLKLLLTFVTNPNAKTGLMILNRRIKINEDAPLSKLLNAISNYLNIKFNTDNLMFLSASDLKNNDIIKAFTDKANNGEKTIIISNKEVAGQGLNLQYDKDINFYFQEDPTNVISNANDRENSLTRAEKNKTIYRIRCMGDRDEIDKKMEREWIEQINITSGRTISYNKEKSIKLAKLYRLIQGWGRITRSTNKEKYTYIYIDENTCELIDELESCQVSKTDEIIEIIKAIKEYNSVEHYSRENSEDFIKFKKELIKTNNNVFVPYLQDILRTFANNTLPKDKEEAIKKYNYLRNLLYDSGFYNKKAKTEVFDMFNEILDKCYVEMPEYYSEYWVHYKDENKHKYYEEIDNVSLHERKGWRKFSYKNNLYKYIPSNNIKKVKEVSRIIVPNACDVLQGLCAEQVTKNLIEKNTPLKLKELLSNDVEMLGDFTIEGHQNIFVDVKGFEDRGIRDITEFATSKLNKIKKKYPDGKLVIINYYAENKYKNKDYNDSNILVVNGIFDGIRVLTERLNHLQKWIETN